MKIVPGYCEIIEVAHVADPLGYPCGKDELGACSDCGIHVCDEHAEKCSVCFHLFCLTCLGFHETGAHEKKPACADIGEQPSRKRA
jgi:hypothetical protein